MAKPPNTSEEMFSAKKMEAIVEKLKAKGRMPSEQEFFRFMGKMRAKYRPLFLAARKKSSK